MPTKKPQEPETTTETWAKVQPDGTLLEVTVDVVDGVIRVDPDVLAGLLAAAGWSQRATPERLAAAERAAADGA
jgi:hypothetical protein